MTQTSWRPSQSKKDLHDSSNCVKTSCQRIELRGVIWDAKEDMLWFTGLKGDLGTARRKILSQAFSVWDPRGLLLPFTIRSKIILQGLNRMKYGWDDELKEADLQEWRE